jgi:hypothetical protein
MLNMRKNTLRALIALSLWAITSLAAADRGTVHLTNGGQVTGELVEYFPGNRVTVDLGGGQRLTFLAAEISGVDIQSSAPAAPAAIESPLTPSPSAPLAGVDPQVQELLLRRHELLRRRIGMGGPIILLSAGAGASALGWLVMFPAGRAFCDDYYDDCTWPPLSVAGAVVGTVGIGLAVWGAALIPARIARRRQRADEINAIDQELMGRGFTARVDPWIRGGKGDVLGLRATLTF